MVGAFSSDSHQFSNLAFIFLQEHHCFIMTSATLPSVQPRRKTRVDQGSRKKAIPRRTTVTLAAPAAEIVENFKAATGLSTSRAIEELILLSQPRKPRVKMVNGRAVFDLPIKKGSITTEQLLRLEEESW
jgi:hypothetical protein